MSVKNRKPHKNDLVNNEKENDEVIKDEKIDFFKLEIYARIAFYGLLIGFVYNYTYFKYCLDFNIFDVMEPNELLFSWLGTPSLLSTIVSLILSYFLIALSKCFIVKDNAKKIFILSFVVSFILSVALVYSYYSCVYKIKNELAYFDIFMSILMFLLIILLTSLISIFNPKDIKRTRMFLIEAIMVFLSIFFTIIFAINEKNDTVNIQKFRISFKSDYLNKPYQYKCEQNKECKDKDLEPKELYYLGKTNSVIIATDKEFQENGNTFITIYSSDISSITYLPKQVHTTVETKK